MVKKIMSSFMACVLLASSLSAPIFAGGNISFTVQYPKKGKTQKTSVFGASESSLQRKRKTVQKAFLTALLLAQDVKVTINNEIVLNENDVINLGQRFYDLIYKMISENALTLYEINRAIHLNVNTGFTKNVKKIFKKYTGKDLTI